MKKLLWQWEKYDVLSYIRKNFLEKEVEFTTETLIKKIEKLSLGSVFGYREKVLSAHLFELHQEGHLSVRYISVDMKPEEHYFHKFVNSNRYLYKNKWRTRWGSKTVALYKIVSINDN